MTDELKDIFGGVLDDARQHRNGHFFVGVGTDDEHCMTCRRSPETAVNPCPGPPYCVTCGGHLDEHQTDSDYGGARVVQTVSPRGVGGHEFKLRTP